MLKKRKIFLIGLVVLMALVFSCTSSFAMEKETNMNMTTFPIYESITEAESRLAEQEAAKIYYAEPIEALGVKPDATMVPFFVRSGTTTKVEMYLKYTGTKSASILSIDLVEIYNDKVWLQPGREMLDLKTNVYVRVPAAKKVNFRVEAFKIPKTEKKVRVDWDNAKVDVTGVGWVKASDPIGAFTID